jgi:hypothetical protein
MAESNRSRSGAKRGPLHWLAVAFTLTLAVNLLLLLTKQGNLPPDMGDSAEYHNLAWNLAHGRGYRFYWDDPDWRRPYQDANTEGQYTYILTRRGGHRTALRPPLLPYVASLLVRLDPDRVFLLWRIVDAFCVSLGVGLATLVALRLGGNVPALFTTGIGAFDPMRRMFAPDWMTEGLAFVGFAGLLWILTRLVERKSLWLVIAAGVSMGLLILARSMLIFLYPPLVLLVALCWWLNGRRARGAAAAAALFTATAVLVPLPWWVRNCVLLEGFMPLGTQGGWTLPGGYSDLAWRNRGVWAGDVRPAIWEQGVAADPALQQELRASGMTDNEMALLAPYPYPDLSNGKMSYAFFCGSTAMEKEGCLVCQRAALDWLVTHWTVLPSLACAKVGSEFWGQRSFLAPVVLLALLSLGLRGTSGALTVIFLLFASGLVAIAATYAMGNGRFLVPCMPALYVLASLGAWRAIRFVHQFDEAPGRAPTGPRIDSTLGGES